MLSDDALFERLLQGDLDAFDRLYERYERPLFGFIRRYLSDPHEAEDVFHEAFMAVLREGQQGRSARSFRAWLFQVARNLCLNRQRTRRRAARAIAAAANAPAEPADQPDEQMARRETSEALRQAVASLPDPLAELYALRAGGMSYAELAEALDVPLGTVKSRVHQMVSRLREEMKA